MNSKRPDFTKVDCTCGWLCGAPMPLAAKANSTSISCGLSASTRRVTLLPASTAGKLADVVGHGRAFQWKSDGSQSETAGM